MFNPGNETGNRIAEAIAYHLTYQPNLTAPATQVCNAVRQMLGHDYHDSVIRKVKAHIGIKQSRVYNTIMWTLPEHLQQIVLDADRQAAAELAEATGKSLDEWQVLWDEHAGREWLVARALAELAITSK
jgi:hypothetical protein